MVAARANPFRRLTRRADFLAAARGRRFHTDRITVQGLGRDPAGSVGADLRIGLTVTKRVGHATERNRIKRRLRRAVADAVGAGRERPPCDIVVVARRSCLDTPYLELVADLARAFGVVTAPRSPKPRHAMPARRPLGSDNA